MRSGLLLAIVFFSFFAFTLAVSCGEAPLFVNRAEVSLALPLLRQDGRLLVPRHEFGLKVGVETAYVEEENAIVLRWAAGRRSFPVDRFPVHEGVYYIHLDKLLTLIDARVHTIGGYLYIETEPLYLLAMEATAERVTVRFDGFVPHESIEAEPGIIHLRFHHSLLATTPRRSVFTGGAITAVTLRRENHQTVDLIVETADGFIPQTRRFDVPGFYSISLSFTDRPLAEVPFTAAPSVEEPLTKATATVEIFPHLTHHTLVTDLGRGSVTINYLHVEEWRRHYRLIPAVSERGVGRLVRLEELARLRMAHAAINANFFDTATGLPVGLLIINGQALRSNHERRAALGIDIFGRLTFFNPAISLFLRIDGGKIAVDDVNRPIRSDEIVVYTAGYHGRIARIPAQSFRVIKVRGNRIIAIHDGPYVTEDRSADLVVASGTARARLAGLRVGDKVNIEHRLDEGDLLITNVVSAGPMLVVEGREVLDPEAESFRPGTRLVDGLAARSLLAVDWHGGLILLTVAANRTSVGADFDDLLTILRMLPVPVRYAIAFDGGHASSLVFKDGVTYREISSGGAVAVGLLLVPTVR
ncbi:phosphodiester glycosidase family protein [Candidatus Bipolaricaulota bacterium]|nr:phosphodiester glycosidase family protein [Candidatus Bipolaricaulota bacterium]